MRASSQLSVDIVIQRSLTIWLQNLASFLVLATVASSPLILYSIVVLHGDMSESELQSYVRVKFLANLICNSLITAFLIQGVFQQLRGQKAEPSASFAAGLKHLLPVLLVGVAVAILIIFGLVMLIIPGLLLMLVFYVAVPVTMVERLGVLDALKRSHQLTNGHKGGVLFIVLMLVVISLFIILLFNSLVGALGADILASLGGVEMVWACLDLLISVVAGSFAAVLHAVVYCHLRMIKDGARAEDLARALD